MISILLLHWVKGSPKKPLEQTQIGTWLFTLHWALTPHRPGQGSRHFLVRHALSSGQSAFTWHSGLQLGGWPIMPGKQVHWQRSPTSLAFAFSPQGFGSQGSSSTIGSIAKTCNMQHTVHSTLIMLDTRHEEKITMKNQHYKQIFVGFSSLRYMHLRSSILWHAEKGSPSYPGWQRQIGRWFTTRHKARIPQVSMQGSIHFSFWQDLTEGQSEWTTHSGFLRHTVYGSPIYPSMQRQAAALCLSMQTAFCPQGVGLQTSIGCVVIRRVAAV